MKNETPEYIQDLVENKTPGLLRRWFDSYAGAGQLPADPDRINPVAIFPFIGMHLAVFFVFLVGFSPVALALCAALYLLRMFAITGFYHRYFSHRSFKTGRVIQFLFALIGGMAVQRGAIWWASHHRVHHVHSDGPEDPHSPKQRGFWWSHMLWFLTPRNYHTDYSRVQDWLIYPELVFLDRFDIVAPVLLAVSTFTLGVGLEQWAPTLQTSGPQLLVWGFVVSTVLLYHGTFFINSLAHVYGSRRFETTDTSRNSLLLSIITLGEGWHNNHHRFAACCRQGFFWWELDITFYILKCMSWLGLIWDIRPVPGRVYRQIEDLKENQSAA